jgi:DNA repair exonuclease SbcCD ATPase subunit
MADEEQVDETTTPDDGAGTETGQGDDFDKDRALATIRKLRESEKAAKAQAKELEDLKARLREIDDKDKSEIEKQAARAQEATAKLTAAEQRAADLALQMAVERAARKLGFIDEDDAYRLIDRRAVETDDAGAPTNVDDLLKALARAKPHLVGDADGGTKNGNGTATRAVPNTPRPAARTGSRDQAIQESQKELRANPRYGF